MKKRINRIARHKRIRKSILGNQKRPRIPIFRSNRHIYVQVIDDLNHKTIISAGGSESENSKGTKKDRAMKTGALLADKIKKLGISEVVFDRGGFKYHGRIQALAESLRENGIKF